MTKVLIMMSTYNGHQYLKEQLDSLYRQQGVDIHILVRDDGSKDSTVDILSDYQASKGRMSVIKANNVGAAKSFYELLRIAVLDYGDFDYYCFSDQDDVWFDNKILTGVSTLEKSTSEYKLFYSKAVITDPRLNPLDGYNLRFKNSFGSNMVGNHILGCAMLFNKALLIEANKINTKPYYIPDGQLPLHDAWVSFVAYSLNAEVIDNAESLMFYRQHGSNVVGVNDTFWDLQKKRIYRYLQPASHQKANKCIIALQVLGDKLTGEKILLYRNVSNYRKNLRAKLKILTNKNIYNDGFFENVGAFLLFALNKF